MKNKKIVFLTALACGVILAIAAYEFNSFQKDAKHIQQITAKQESVLLELEKLSKEMESLKAIRYKPLELY